MENNKFKVGDMVKVVSLPKTLAPAVWLIDTSAQVGHIDDDVDGLNVGLRLPDYPLPIFVNYDNIELI
jgi:hypothetical protein